MKHKLLFIYLFIAIFFYNTSKAQNVQWENTIGGTNIDWSDFIELSNDKNYLVGGYSYSNISGDKTENSRGLADYWLLKINQGDGSIIWQKTIGGMGYDHLVTAKETSDGGYILGGYSESLISGEKTENSRGNDDYWIIKLDSNRNIVWQKTFGGSGTDRVKSLIITKDGSYLISGTSDSNISGEKNENSNGDLDIWTIKIDKIGNLIWQKTYGGNNSDSIESAIESNDGNFILVGSSTSNISGNKTENSKGLGDYWILKIDQTGGLIWQKTIGGSNGDYAKSIVKTPDDNYIIGGESSSNVSGDKTIKTFNNSNDLWLLKINENGQILWQRNFGGNDNDSFSSIKNTSDGGFIMAAMSYSGISGNKTEASIGDRDFWIIKLDSNGNLQWDKSIGGTGIDQPQDIIQGSDNGYAITGWSQSDKSGYKSEDKIGTQDFWIAKINICNTNVNSLNSNSPICIGKTLELKASGGTNYLWTGPNGFTSTDQNPTITNAASINSGEYSCLITGTGGCDDTKKITVVIGDIEAPRPDVINLPTITGDCHTTINTIPTATDVCAGSIIATTINTLSYSLPGTYTIVWNYNDGNGNHSSQEQTVIITSQPLPVAETPQTFCIQQNATLDNIVINGQNIKWYDAATAGTLLPNTTVLQNNTIYYATQTINGCESEMIAVTTNIQNTLAPTGNANQPFCSGQNPTIANIEVTGSLLKWYDASSNGSLLAETTNLQDGKTYYVSQTINNCEGPRLGITVSIVNTPSFPTANSTQSFCKSENATLTNIQISGQNIKWYDTNFAAAVLPNTTLLENNKTYYASQTIGCEGDRTPILVHVYDTAVPNGNSYQQFCIDENATIADIAITGTALKWYDAAVNGNSLSEITVLQNGTYYVTQTLDNCESKRLAISVKIQDTQNPLAQTPQAFCVQENASISDIKISGENIKWFESNSSNITLSESTPLQNRVTYYASQTINNCESDRIPVTIYILEATTADCINFVDELPFPKFFTPNNDGYNDTWTIDFAHLAPNTGIRIFDRYGKFIKELFNNASWDGNYLGKQEPASDYWFTVTRLNGTEYRGHFSLKR